MMNVIKLLLAAFFFISILSCIENTQTIDLSKYLKKLADCDPMSINCPDTIYYADQATDISFFNISSINDCFNKENNANIDELEKIQFSSAFDNFNIGRLKKFSFNKTFIPPKISSPKRVHIVYSDVFKHNAKYFIFFNKYISGKELVFSYCSLVKKNDSFQVGSCSCELNPF